MGTADAEGGGLGQKPAGTLVALWSWLSSPVFRLEPQLDAKS